MTPSPRNLLVVCASHAPGMDRDTEGRIAPSFRSGVAEARSRVDEFDPELVVLFGGDHRRAFKSVTPAFSVVYSASLLAEGAHPAAELNVPLDTAKALGEHLLDAGFDVAVCRDVALDHAFGQPLSHFLGAVDRVPVLPIPVNCAAPPLPGAQRAVDFGSAIGDFLAGLDKRVLVIGTGGLSHHPASLDNDRYDLSDEERRELNIRTAEAARTRINPDWDERFLASMECWDLPTLVEMTDSCLDEAGVGANEVRTWLAAAATVGGKGMQAVAYEPVPEWITGMGAMTSVGAS